jgi:membrane-associated phospholipid phosphatase
MEPSIDQQTTYRRLLGTSLVAVVVCVGLVALCYIFVDRPVALFVHEHRLSQIQFLKWLQDPPPVLQSLAPVALVALAVRRAYGPFLKWQLTIMAACISLLVAVQFKETLKIAFGRYWPETWTNDNPSFLGSGAYGFHPFHDGDWYASFPSGHMTRTIAITAVIWIAYPRWRWLCLLAPAAVATGLIGMNYHFVSDVIAGGFVGGIVGMYVARGLGLGTV